MIGLLEQNEGIGFWKVGGTIKDTDLGFLG